MKYEYNKKCEITYSNVDKELKVSLINAMDLAQDTMTAYFDTINSDNETNKTKNNAVWVLTKTKVHFEKYPRLGDILEAKSYTTEKKLARVKIETNFKKDNETAFIVAQECCPIDVSTRKIRKINTISYPDDMECMEAGLNNSFSKLNDKFQENDKVYDQKILATDIDFNNHTNNVMYVKYIINAFNSDFWIEHKIKDFEIHYINESREGDILSIYQKTTENEMEFLIKNNEKEVVRANIIFEVK